MDQFYFEVNLIFLAKSKVRSGRKPGKLSWAQNFKALVQLTCIFQPMDQFFQVLLGLFPGCVTILENAGVAKKCVKLLMIFAFGTQDFTHRYHCLKSGFKILSCQCWSQTVRNWITLLENLRFCPKIQFLEKMTKSLFWIFMPSFLVLYF